MTKPRRWALVVAGIYALLAFLAYLPGNEPSSLPGGLALISGVIPLAAWAVLWLTSAVVCFVSAVLSKHTAAWTMWATLVALWGAAYLVSYGIGLYQFAVHGVGEPSREWLNGRTYLGPVIIILLLLPERTVEVRD